MSRLNSRISRLSIQSLKAGGYVIRLIMLMSDIPLVAIF